MLFREKNIKPNLVVSRKTLADLLVVLESRIPISRFVVERYRLSLTGLLIASRWLYLGFIPPQASQETKGYDMRTKTVKKHQHLAKNPYLSLY